MENNKKPLVDLYTDGSARGNPNGPGGYAAVLLFTDTKGQLHTREISQGYRLTTNNRMELRGVIEGLKLLNRPCEVRVHTDSQYIVNAFQKKWIDSWQKKNWRGSQGPVKNPDLWKELLRVMAPHSVEYIWVRGHDGNHYNERCDELAVSAALSGNLLEDTLVEA